MNRIDLINKIISNNISLRTEFHLLVRAYNEKLGVNKEIFNILHDVITTTGKSAFKDESEYSSACELCISISLFYNDYINPNNIMQCYKEEMKGKLAPWFYLFSILIYSKRVPQYYLNRPNRFLDKMKRCIKDIDKTKLMGVLCEVIKFYFEYVEIFVEHKKLISDFTKKLLDEKFEGFNEFYIGVKELNDFACDRIQLEDINYNFLVFSVDTYPQTVKSESDLVEIDDKQVKMSGFTTHKPSILIIGDTKIKNNEIYGIAKSLGIDKSQLEIINDYDRITNFDISKIRFSSKYCGIVVGPVPHSIKGLGDNNSLIQLLENEDGYPYYHVCKTTSDQLKITKSSLRQALSSVINHYNGVCFNQPVTVS